MLGEILSKLAVFVARRPGVVVSLIAIILILSTFSAQNIKLVSGTESFFSKDNDVYRQYQLYKKDFGVGTNDVFIFIKGDEIVSRDVYEYMLDLENSLKELDGVSGTVSPASIIVEILGYLPPDESVLSQLTDRYAANLIPRPSLGIIIVHLTSADRVKQEEIAKNIEKAIEFNKPPTGIIVQITGEPVLGYQIKKEIQRSLGITMSVSIILMVLILYLTFSGVVRKKYTAFMPLIVSVFAVTIVYGLMPIIGIPLSEHTNGALPMLIGLAIEYAAQLQNRYEEERREGRSIDDSIRISITRTGLAIVMALATTVIGFMSMLAPGVPAMAWFGIVASLGLIIAYFLTLTFLPAVLKMLERKKEEKEEVEEKEMRVKEAGLLERTLSFVSGLTASRPYGILVFATLIILLGAYGSTQIELETNYNKYVPQSLPAIQRFHELERVVGGQAIYTLVLSTEKVDAETLKEIDSLASYIVEKEELVYDYDSLSSVVKKFGKLPENDAEFAYILDRIPESELKRYISGSLIAIHFSSNAQGYEEYKSTLESIQQDVEFFGWKGGYYLTGSPVLSTEIGTIMINSQTTMTLVAYALIVILLLAVYRSIRKAIVPLVAITTVIGVMNTVMFLSGVKQTMVSIALNSITLGLGIDFSIHILERYFEERERFSPIESVRRTIERTGKAITTSALTMAGGFGSLMFSTFPVMRDFGFLALVAIIFSLIAALTVVPAFLMVTERVKINLRVNKNAVTS
jgi:hypothetical protein